MIINHHVLVIIYVYIYTRISMYFGILVGFLGNSDTIYDNQSSYFIYHIYIQIYVDLCILGLQQDFLGIPTPHTMISHQVLNIIYIYIYVYIYLFILGLLQDVQGISTPYMIINHHVVDIIYVYIYVYISMYFRIIVGLLGISTPYKIISHHVLVITCILIYIYIYVFQDCSRMSREFRNRI